MLIKELSNGSKFIREEGTFDKHRIKFVDSNGKEYIYKDYDIFRNVKIFADMNDKNNVSDAIEEIYLIYGINDTSLLAMEKIVDKYSHFWKNNSTFLFEKLAYLLLFTFQSEDVYDKNGVKYFNRSMKMDGIRRVLRGDNPDSVASLYKGKDKREIEMLFRYTNLKGGKQKALDIGSDESNGTTIPETVPGAIHKDKRGEAKIENKSENKSESLLDKVTRQKRIKSGEADAADYWK